MESQYKQQASMAGLMGSDVKAEEQARPAGVRASHVSYYNDMVLRGLGLAFTLVAAVVAGLDEETKIIPITVVDSMPPLHVAVTAKWHYMSATLYFVVANAIACSYAAGSLVLSTVSGAGKNGTTLALLISDLIMVALLFSANGAASAVGVIALTGNSHVQWHKVCHVFKKYCHHGAASIVMSMLGSGAFLWLVVFATLSLHKKSR
ncbi:hypothetical protein RJ639_019051 [Escallonia herrerae]|uniref:CASP-like protein n=1 Tax=Escallonia herrerae TaxID=1293975 RepID=A0AA89AJ15_9ASTE|nr:hypothetical protein RJ639_019051 [Escallonia herrerae]